MAAFKCLTIARLIMIVYVIDASNAKDYYKIFLLLKQLINGHLFSPFSSCSAQSLLRLYLKHYLSCIVDDCLQLIKQKLTCRHNCWLSRFQYV